MPDAGREHTSLAGAGAGQHQQRPTLVDDREPLLLVQSVKVRFRRNDTRSHGLGRRIVGDVKRVGGGRHTHHIAIVGPNAYLERQHAEDFAWPEV